MVDGYAVDVAAQRQHKLLVQRSRSWAYTALVALAALLFGVSEIPARYLDMFLLWAGAQLTVGAFVLLAVRDVEARRRIDLAPVWIVFDVVVISLGIVISGGIASPWYLIYLASTFAAAFVRGPRFVLFTDGLITLAYLITLGAMGQLKLFDAAFFLALTRMVLLHCVSLFAVMGIVDQKRKRQLISRLQEEESRKVAELTRLTGELDERTRALAKANTRIREADRHKSAFLANMSHELRTPLNSIIGFSEVLTMRLDGQLEPKLGRFLGNIHASGTHLLGLINDILDLSKIEAGKMDLQPDRVDVAGLIDGVFSVMKGVAGPRGIQFELINERAPATIEADPSRLRQVLYNLLSNAVKFSPDGSTVTVRLRAPDDDSCEIAVIDRGIGIAPEHHDLVFQEFRQVDGSASRKFQGTGLGLTLVRRFVELHGGRVNLESQPGKGSTFRVTLPRQYDARVDTMQARFAEVSKDDPRPLVLVVEDDVAAYERISAALSTGGYRFLRANNGDEAVALARAARPAAITLDVVLPGTGGFEVLRELKADSLTADIPIIVVSLLDNREVGLALGADDYFLKPPDTTQLVQRVRELVSSPRARLLVIDDDPAVHELLDVTLTARGYVVEHARSGEEGLACAAASTPDLVILDLMLEGMDGFHVAAWLKSQLTTAEVPILVLTSKDLSLEEQRRLGGHVVRKKGGAPEAELMAMMQGLLKRRHTERA